MLKEPVVMLVDVNKAKSKKKLAVKNKLIKKAIQREIKQKGVTIPLKSSRELMATRSKARAKNASKRTIFRPQKKKPLKYLKLNVSKTTLWN